MDLTGRPLIVRIVMQGALLCALCGGVAPSADGQINHPRTDPPKAEPPKVVPLKADSSASPAIRPATIDWWSPIVSKSLLDQPRWVSFDIETILLDTLRNSPRIQSVSARTSVALENIVQQDAVFDSAVLFESSIGRANDPVGNTLTTGGPPRLIEETVNSRAGVRRTGRRGTEVVIAQEMGLLDNNSIFLDPQQQGSSRLSLSVTQPLMGRGGRVYNERLLTQARLDSQISWQEMRGDVEQRVTQVIASYWRLYELRCHLLQQHALLERGERIQKILSARDDYDSSRIELAKARQRVARRIDRQLQLTAEIRKQQVQLAALIGAEELRGTGGTLELIPLSTSTFPEVDIDLHDALVQGIENRPEVRSATVALEQAALSVQVTKTELMPLVTGVVNTYLAGLNGNNRVLDSLTDQFTQGGPGISAALQYDRPNGQRAARSRHRQAHHRYRQRSEELREMIQGTRADIESALINVDTAKQQRATKQRLLAAAAEEEKVLTARWEMMGSDGAAVGTVLENLLDAQQRRTDAEREWTSAKVRYTTSLVELQRAMGTLLIKHSIEPVRHGRHAGVHFQVLGGVQEATQEKMDQ